MFWRCVGLICALALLGLAVRGYLHWNPLNWRHYYADLNLGAVVAVLGFGGLSCRVWARKKRLEASGWAVLKAWLTVERLLLALYLLGLGLIVWNWRGSNLYSQAQFLRQFLVLSIYLIVARLLLEPGRSAQVLRGFEQGWPQPPSLKRQNHLDLASALLILLSALALQGYLVRHWI